MMKIIRSKTFRKWEAKLKDKNVSFAIAARVNRMTQGLFGDVKPIGKGISEIRIHYGAGYRVYFQQRDKEFILLLCGGDKSSQQRDIEKAQQIAKQWSEKNE